jgi:hypothetical protein
MWEAVVVDLFLIAIALRVYTTRAKMLQILHEAASQHGEINEIFRDVAYELRSPLVSSSFAIFTSHWILSSDPDPDLMLFRREQIVEIDLIPGQHFVRVSTPCKLIVCFESGREIFFEKGYMGSRTAYRRLREVFGPIPTTKRTYKQLSFIEEPENTV